MYSTIVWIALFVVFVVLESCTYQLICAWFAIGAAVSAICAGIGIGSMWQTVIFLTVSVVCLILLRPVSLKLIKPNKFKSNVDNLVGQKITVISDADDTSYSGKGTVGGMEWTVRCMEGQRIPAGSTAYIRNVEGVKLIISSEKG